MFVYCSPKTIKCTQKPKIEKEFTAVDQSSERASVRVLFPTSHLQLALAHARNSRVKKKGVFYRLRVGPDGGKTYSQLANNIYIFLLTGHFQFRHITSRNNVFVFEGLIKEKSPFEMRSVVLKFPAYKSRSVFM